MKLSAFEPANLMQGFSADMEKQALEKLKVCKVGQGSNGYQWAIPREMEILCHTAHDNSSYMSEL